MHTSGRGHLNRCLYFNADSRLKEGKVLTELSGNYLKEKLGVNNLKLEHNAITTMSHINYDVCSFWPVRVMNNVDNKDCTRRQPPLS